MSTQILSNGGSTTAVSLVTFRWGGGAEPGKYHIFLLNAGTGSFFKTIQCVVDDFGTLVDCETGRPA